MCFQRSYFHYHQQRLFYVSGETRHFQTLDTKSQECIEGGMPFVCVQAVSCIHHLYIFQSNRITPALSVWKVRENKPFSDTCSLQKPCSMTLRISTQMHFGDSFAVIIRTSSANHSDSACSHKNVRYLFEWAFFWLTFWHTPCDIMHDYLLGSELCCCGETKPHP